MAGADDAGSFDADDIATPIHHLGQLPHVWRLIGGNFISLRGEPAVAEQKSRKA